MTIIIMTVIIMISFSTQLTISCTMDSLPGRLGQRIDFLKTPVTVWHNSVNTQSTDFQKLPGPLWIYRSAHDPAVGDGKSRWADRGEGPTCTHGQPPASLTCRGPRLIHLRPRCQMPHFPQRRSLSKVLWTLHFYKSGRIVKPAPRELLFLGKCLFPVHVGEGLPLTLFLKAF